MKKIILYGNTEFAKMMKYYIETDTDREIAFFTVERDYIKEKEIESIDVIPFEEVKEENYSTEEYEILICIGYSHMNELRKKIYNKCKALGYTIASYIHSSTRIPNGTVIGEGNIILEDVTIQPFVQIGKSNLIWYKAAIAHDCIIGNFNTLCGMMSLSGCVKINNNCFIGNNATIRDHVEISDYTLIGAGAYIGENTEEHSVYVPQRVVKLNKKSIEIKL
jgi:sugar O-acyltransferase (sialic acid O-acetyltransferase NeuD family)